MRTLSQRSWWMFRMTVKPWRETSPFLGIGTYYRRPESERMHRADGWVKVTLERPLVLSTRQMRKLVHQYGTRSPDAMAAMAGAWRLRRDILARGHDGVIAIEDVPSESRLTVVDLARGGASARRRAAEISRLPRTGIPSESGSRL